MLESERDKSVMIYGPNGQPISGSPKMDPAKDAEAIAAIVDRQKQKILGECLRDVCGGIVPSKKKVQKFIRREVFKDGELFYWRGEKLVWFSHFQTQMNKETNQFRVGVPFKKLYLQTPDKPLEASN